MVRWVIEGAVAGLLVLGLAGCGDDGGGAGGDGAGEGGGGSSAAGGPSGIVSPEVAAAIEAFCDAACACGSCSDEDRADCEEAYRGYELSAGNACEEGYLGAFECASERQTTCDEEPVTSLETCETELSGACQGA